MSNQHEIRDAADAVKGIVEAVPIYQDVLQPAAKQVGLALETVAKTVHIALAPISVLVWGYDEIRDFVSHRVAEKLHGTPLDRIKTPDPHVVGPALVALRYTGHHESLRELYGNLLATSLDADTCRNAHPAFVDIIKNMSPDEARIMRLFAIRDTFPLIQVRAAEIGSGDYEIVVRSFSLIGREAGCEHVALVPTYIDNLARLGLLQVLGIHGLGSPTLSGPNTYEPLETSTDLDQVRDKVAAEGGKRLEFSRGLLQVTDFGQQFCRACVIERGSAAA